MTDPVLVETSELFGDGVFETVHLRPSGPWLLDAHLDRLARSAALLGIVPPSREALLSEVSKFPAPPAASSPAASLSSSSEAALRIILTRVSLHVTMSPIPATVLRERRDGIRMITHGLGFAIGTRPPWSLSGAKSLSYGESFAAKRWAGTRGADDLLWFSSDGYALEAPTASLVWLSGTELCTVPAGPAQILPGTTAGELLRLAPGVGLTASERLVTLPELVRADGIWLASALRGLAEVTVLDGAPRTRSGMTYRLLDLLGF